MRTLPAKRGLALAILIAMGIICPLIATSSYATPVCELICLLDGPSASALFPQGASVSFDGRSYNVEYKDDFTNGYSIDSPPEPPPYTHFSN